MATSSHEQELDFFSFLPLVIVIDILSRLPIRTILVCKCVCRSWRDLLCTREFANFHISKSFPGLFIAAAIFHKRPKDVKLFEFDDEPLTKIDSMDSTRSSALQGSTNVLLLLHRIKYGIYHVLIVCNPITREYIDIPVYEDYMPSTYGFGVSRVTRRIKVVKISHDSICHIYVLGTRKWRRIGPAPKFQYKGNAVTLNGNLHWLVEDLDGRLYISWFDLEAEAFRTFSLPVNKELFPISVATLGDCLCVCDNAVELLDIWLMKEYGDTKSWTKKFVIRTNPDIHDDDVINVMHPIIFPKDGDILMAIEYKRTIYLYNRTKGSEVFRGTTFDLCDMIAMLHTPSFVSLSSLPNEKVRHY